VGQNIPNQFNNRQRPVYFPKEKKISVRQTPFDWLMEVAHIPFSTFFFSYWADSQPYNAFLAQ
jgi:hypothetical protein